MASPGMSGSGSGSPVNERVTENRSKNMNSNIFDDSPSKRVSVNQTTSPQNNKSVQDNREKKGLSPFPDFSVSSGDIMTPKIEIQYEERKNLLGVQRRMQFQPGDRLRSMREEMNKDFDQFNDRMRELTSRVSNINFDVIEMPKMKEKVENEEKPEITTKTIFIYPDGSEFSSQ